jgi:ditrans,polycis-polyprenyl diphosphate synthase
MPRHLAFVMDGNRRWARLHDTTRYVGHERGYQALVRVIECCSLLGITYITAFSFSIENLARPQAEVEALFRLLEKQLNRLLEPDSLIDRLHVTLNIMGDLRLLPNASLRASLAKAVIESQRRAAARQAEAEAAGLPPPHEMVLNLAFLYSSQHEMAHAASRILSSGIHPSQYTPEIFQQCLWTGNSPPPDVLVRTSGEVRLSNFLLWQTSNSNTLLHFVSRLWPDFGAADLVRVVLRYQVCARRRAAVEEKIASTQRLRVKELTAQRREYEARLDRQVAGNAFQPPDAELRNAGLVSRPGPAPPAVRRVADVVRHEDSELDSSAVDPDAHLLCRDKAVSKHFGASDGDDELLSLGSRPSAAAALLAAHPGAPLATTDEEGAQGGQEPPAIDATVSEASNSMIARPSSRAAFFFGGDQESGATSDMSDSVHSEVDVAAFMNAVSARHTNLLAAWATGTFDATD